ncbi:MAG: hypothetical protein GY715_13640 [Planctomycetes bacterium]|nr:hypothetical protein [Planctomycetota bacterium]
MRRSALIPTAGALILGMVASGCATAPRGVVDSAPAAPGRFREVAAEAGIDHRHAKPVLDHQLDNIMPWLCTVGAAAATADYDGDGWLDLYVTDSRKGRPNRLYRNNGDGTFTDVAEVAGVASVNGDDGTSMDCAWGDVDNDGDPDLYVVRWGRDLLFANNGDGTFDDVTDRRFRRRDGSLGTQWANGNAVLFMDYDGDGRLDVYVGNYFAEVDLWRLDSTRIMHDDFERARNGGENFLYRQEPDGTFTEVARSLGLNDPGWTLAVGSADVDNDGWPDLYCANDFGPDQLFLNRRDGSFANVSDAAIGFDTKKGMSVDFGDFNNDGWLDVYVSNITTAEYLQEGNMLWHNNGPSEEGGITLTDVSLETGTYDGGWGWGAKFFDADNDRDLDLVAANGFISAGEGNYWYDLASWTVVGDDPTNAANWPTIGDRSFSGYEPLRFWRNDGFGSFSECSGVTGLASDRDGRGVVCFDYDNDGDVDVFIANQGQPAELFRNEAPAEAHWLEVALVADPTTGVNADAIGARVSVVTVSGRQIRERDGGNGYCGQSDPRLHFGLGPDERVQLLEVRWPDGGLQYLEDLPADRHIVVRQDPRRYASRVVLEVGKPQPWRPADDADAARAPTIAPEEVERRLTVLERLLRDRPPVRELASRYRARCAEYGEHDRSIVFFRELVEADPGDRFAALELSCAYIDKIPTRGGIAAVVSKGTLARKSLDILDELLEDDPRWWLALYCRGMNHLHWPRALRHNAAAADDFRRCIELQRRSGAGAGRPYYVRAHIARGDALAKDGRYGDARRAWRSGLRLFPGNPELLRRLDRKDRRDVRALIEDVRTLERPIDTDLGFIDP